MDAWMLTAISQSDPATAIKGVSVSWILQKTGRNMFHWLVLLAIPTVASAGPWIYPGNIRLRHQIQFLSDSGHIRAPLTTWPLAAGDLSAELRGQRKAQGFAHYTALHQVRKALHRRSFRGWSVPKAKLSAVADPIQLRTFEDTPRAEGELEAGISWMGDMLAMRLNVGAVKDPPDGKELRLDDSYAGLALGNWMLSVSTMPRWWGPGWQGSLILSNNARPVPTLALERNQSDPFEMPVLRWLGPWKFIFFLGQLEGDRVISDARLIGARLNFRPTRKLEIGLSRAAQWGGDGRPDDFASFIDVLRGESNTENPEEDPGNQLAGIDLRWRSPLVGNLPYAVYTQWMGEDEAGGLPSKWIGQAGIELWGVSSTLAGTYRFYLEATDTATRFLRSKTEFNVAFNHSVYQSGFRFRERSLAHTADSDSQMLSLGGILAQNNGLTWHGVLRYAELNRDGEGQNPLAPNGDDLLGLFLSSRVPLEIGGMDYGRLKVGGSLDRIEPGTRDSELDANIFLEWQWRSAL